MFDQIGQACDHLQGVWWIGFAVIGFQVIIDAQHDEALYQSSTLLCKDAL